jgi:DNA-binding beta-propeller fold protein YncE
MELPLTVATAMHRTHLLSAVVNLGLLVVLAAPSTHAQQPTRTMGPHPVNTSAALKPPPGAVPRFELDPTWPKTLPPTWTWRDTTVRGSDVLGIHADARDHVWISNRGQIAEYDPTGNLIKVLDRPAPPIPPPAAGEQPRGYSAIHGMYLDHKGFLWTTGRDEHQILKIAQDGKLVMALGVFGQTAGSLDSTRLGRPAEVYVDEQTNELYAVDGYTNHRVVVFDAETGKLLRFWGAYGKRPDDAARDRPVAGQNAAVTQLNVPHGITGSRDGLIYAADRTNSRIQVFKRNGEFVKEAFTRTGTGGAFSVALSPDQAQEFVYVTDGTGHRIVIMRRSTMEVIGQFSREGRAPGEVARPHNITVDSQGNIYVAEAAPGQRAQKFLFKGWMPK